MARFVDFLLGTCGNWVVQGDDRKRFVTELKRLIVAQEDHFVHDCNLHEGSRAAKVIESSRQLLIALVNQFIHFDVLSVGIALGLFDHNDLISRRVVSQKRFNAIA